MKKFLLCIVLAMSLITNVFALEKYTIDPKHSFVAYNINHLGFTVQNGKWFVDGTILVDQNNPQNSQVNVTIPIANLDSGIPDLNQHLMGPLFFDIEHFKTATFVSTKATANDKTSGIMTGTLTLKGISKPVTLQVKLNQAGISPITNKMTLGFSASGVIKRSDFGMTTLLPALGDEVMLNIQVEAYKDQA